MATDMSSQLEAIKTQMQNPSQQPQSRDRRKQRDAKREGVTDIDLSAMGTQKVSTHNPKPTKGGWDGGERIKQWEGEPNDEGWSDMRKSNFGYGPKNKYRRPDDDTRRSPGTFSPEKQPTKVDGIQGKIEKKELPPKIKQTPEEIFQIHAFADQLLSVLHSTEIVLDILKKLKVDETYENTIKNLIEGAGKTGEELLITKTVEEMLHIKLIMRKLALDIARLPINYTIDIPEDFKTDYDGAFKQVMDFGKESEVQGSREVAPAMIQKRDELETVGKTGLKVLRPATELNNPTWIPSKSINIPKKFKRIPLDADDAARDHAADKARKAPEDVVEYERRKEVRALLATAQAPKTPDVIEPAEEITMEIIDMVEKMGNDGKDPTAELFSEYSNGAIDREKAERIIKELKTQGILN